MRNCPKINITIPADLLDRADDYADANGQTRSGLISLALKQYLDTQALAPDMRRMMSAFARLTEQAATGQISASDAALQIDNMENEINLAKGQLSIL